MERKSVNNKNQIMREFWECKSQMRYSSGGDDYINGLLWPPRSYTCSFCKREFRSAQALGGHMNVHRRDRARLRQSSPPPTTATHDTHSINLNLNPTTMSLLPSSSTTMLKKPFSTTATHLPSLVSPGPPPPASNTSSYDLKKWVVDGIMLNPSSTKASSESTKKMKNNATSLSVGFGDHCNDPFAQEDGGCKTVEKADIIRLDLHIGLLSDSKDDLDLELRLGTYAN